MEFYLLYDVIIIFALSIVILLIFHRLRLPSIIGFLITGIISGPYGFGFVSSVHEVEILSEIGILLLLFTIGIEFSLKEMVQLKKPVLIGGTLQVLLTIILISLIFNSVAKSLNEAIFIGFLVALSSTAILLKIYSEKGEIETPQGRVLLSILIFQDIIVVLMILVTPLLAGASGNIGSAILILLLKALAVILFVFIGTKYVVPFILHRVTRTRSRELFLFTILVICFGIVWITGELGLSLALGAFLAGLVISESEYSHQALSHVMPFRDAFSSLFFVSIGMLLNINFLLENLLLALILSLTVIVIKSLAGITAIRILKMPWRISIIAGISLAQVGEFSFILSKIGMSNGFLNDNFYQNFLSVSILTMSFTPVLLKVSPFIGNTVGKLLKDKTPIPFSSGKKKKLKDHLIIVGYGINGKNLARAASNAGIDFVILEMNPDTLKEEKQKGTNIIYGDAMYPEVLHQANVDEARILVVAINDPSAVQKITVQVKSMNKNIYLIVRTRHVKEVEPLIKLGADEVIPEEFETSVEIFTRVLAKYLIPRNEIEKFINEIRSDSYEMFRATSKDLSSLSNFKLHFPELEIYSFIVSPNSNFSNKTLASLDLRNQYGISILAIKRDEEIISNPSASNVLKPGDMVFILTKHEKIAELSDIFS